MLTTAQGRTLHRLPHEWEVAQARFSADGRWLTTVTGLVSADSAEPSATALPGSTLRVWEVATGALRTELSFAATGGLQQAAFAPAGLWAATVVGEPDAEAGGPGTQRALAWPLLPQLLQSTACVAVARNLSASEWQRYLLTAPWRETCPGKPPAAE